MEVEEHNCGNEGAVCTECLKCSAWTAWNLKSWGIGGGQQVVMNSMTTADDEYSMNGQGSWGSTYSEHRREFDARPLVPNLRSMVIMHTILHLNPCDDGLGLNVSSADTPNESLIIVKITYPRSHHIHS